MISTLLSYALASLCLPGQPPMETTESLGQGVLVLDSGRLYEGRIDRVGKLYRVTSGGRAEMVTEANVAFQGQTKGEAYEYLKGKKKSGVAEDAARLADWCLKNAMPKQAVDEARSAARLSPDDRAVAKLVRDCEEAAKKAVANPVIRVVGNSPAAAPSAAPPVTVPTIAVVGTPKTTPSKSVELETAFAKLVQPVLMNQCVNCHGDPGHAGPFRLVRIPDGIIFSPRTADNFAAAVSHVNKDQPAASPLIAKALSPHGGRTSTLLIRNGTAHKNFEAWAITAASVIPSPPKSVVTVSESTIAPPPVPTTTVEPKPLPTLPAVPPTPSPAKSADPFDPNEFNKANGVKKQ